MKKLFLTLIFILLGGAYIFYSSNKEMKNLKNDTLKVGVTAGPHATILEKVKEIAQKENLHLEIIEFNDFILPNEALDNGDLDVNVYQHEPFLKEQILKRGYKIAKVANTVLMPLHIYSKNLKTLDELKTGDTIAIPNDPTNGGRALLLLEKAGLVQLKAKENPTVLNIQHNSKQLKIIEIEAPQLPRILEDVAAAVINTDWIIVSKIDPGLAIYKEDATSPYANIIVVEESKKDEEKIKKFVKIYHSAVVKNFIKEIFKDSIIPAW